MKKILVLWLAVCLGLSSASLPVLAEDVSAAVLGSDDFEADTVDAAPDWTYFSVAPTIESSKIEAVSAEDVYSFGLGTKTASFRSNVDWGYYMAFDEISENVRAGQGSAQNGYTVDISFDLNVGENGTLVRVICKQGNGSSWDLSNSLIAIMFKNNMAYCYSRNLGTVKAQENLVTALGAYAADENHVFRVRLVYKRKDADGNDVCKYDVYIDGVKVFADIAYDDSSKQSFIAGLVTSLATINSGSNKPELEIGKIDNVMAVEYDSALTVPYTEPGLKRDALVAAIRKSASYLASDEVGDSIKAELESAVTAAKTVYEDAAASTEAVESAAAAVYEAIEEAQTDMDTPDPIAFNYIVNNDFESGSDVPFTGKVTTATDTALLTGTVWKLTEDAESNVFEGVNIRENVGYPAGTDSVTEFDLKLDNFNASGGSLTLTQFYSDSPDATPISEITFNNGQIKSNSYVAEQSGVTQLLLADDAFDDGEWHRIKIVQHSVTAQGALSTKMSLYVDGVCAMENFDRRSTTLAKTKIYDTLHILGATTDVGVYIDNLKIYRIDPTMSGIPLEMGRVIGAARKIQRFLATAQAGDEIGQYNADDISALQSLYDDAAAAIESLSTQSAADEKAAELENALGRIKPNSDEKVCVESITYNTADLTDESVNSIDTQISLYTTRISDETNDILALSVLYENSDDYAGGKMLKADAQALSIAKQSTGSASLSIDLSAYSSEERANLYVKTYVLSGSGRYVLSETENGGVGTQNASDAETDELFASNAQLYKKVLADGSVKLSLSMKSSANDEIIVFALPDGTNGLSAITDANADEKLSYVNVIKANAEGEAVCEFAPASYGAYKVAAYSTNSKTVLLNSDCNFESNAMLSAKLTELSDGTVDITDEASRKLLDLDTDEYAQAENGGIKMDSITADVFAKVASPDAYTFKKEYLALADTLYSVKTAGNTDEVQAAVEGYGLKNTDDAYLWTQRCENVYNNRTTVTKKSVLDTLLSYTPATVTTRPPVSDNGGGGGGGGGGYVSTAASKTGEEAAQPTPYQQNTGIFNDIDGYEWAQEAIIYMAKNGIINGKAEGIFAPADYITREEFTKIIVNMFNIQSTQSGGEFSDVSESAWYYVSVKAASENGIVNGIGGGLFGVGSQIKREDACVMLYRAGLLRGAVFSEDAEYIPFEDGCSDYALEAVENLAKSNVVRGTGNNMLSGKKPLSRAEAAKMIYSLYSFMNNN